MSYDFPADFEWGTATAAYQIEGAIADEGRKPSVWDTFCAMSGRIFKGGYGSDRMVSPSVSLAQYCVPGPMRTLMKGAVFIKL